MISPARAALECLDDVDAGAQDRVLSWLRATDSVDLDVGTFGQLVNVGSEQAARIAEALTEHAVFARQERRVCINEGCEVILSNESIREGRCGRCGADLAEGEPRREVRYSLDRPRSRDLGWIIALHGIRTLGPWQEELQWLVDRQFRRTVPFKNWKYGRILVSALIPPLQRRLVRRFLTDVAEAQNDINRTLGSATPPPDVIAHSFGSWIVAHALEKDASLRVGKLILVGSIVRPDWPWSAALARGQVSAVLNYCGDRDPWVRLAEHFIPDSGPSGTAGFIDHEDPIRNILMIGGAHSSAFTPDSLLPTFEDVWRPFLSDRTEDIDMNGRQLLTSNGWTRAARISRAPAFLLLVLATLAVMLLVALLWA